MNWLVTAAAQSLGLALVAPDGQLRKCITWLLHHQSMLHYRSQLHLHWKDINNALALASYAAHGYICLLVMADSHPTLSVLLL